MRSNTLPTKYLKIAILAFTAFWSASLPAIMASSQIIFCLNDYIYLTVSTNPESVALKVEDDRGQPLPMAEDFGLPFPSPGYPFNIAISKFFPEACQIDLMSNEVITCSSDRSSSLRFGYSDSQISLAGGRFSLRRRQNVGTNGNMDTHYEAEIVYLIVNDQGVSQSSELHLKKMKCEVVNL